MDGAQWLGDGTNDVVDGTTGFFAGMFGGDDGNDDDNE